MCVGLSAQSSSETTRLSVEHNSGHHQKLEVELESNDRRLVPPMVALGQPVSCTMACIELAYGLPLKWDELVFGQIRSSCGEPSHQLSDKRGICNRGWDHNNATIVNVVAGLTQRLHIYKTMSSLAS